MKGWTTEMTARVLIVEDEALVAAFVTATLEDLGYHPIGVAADATGALSLAALEPDVALVDVNLRDGETGPSIGQTLAERHRIAVLFVTANPRRLGDGVPGALGVVTKPCDDETIAAAMDFAVARRRGEARPAPRAVRPFPNAA